VLGTTVLLRETSARAPIAALAERLRASAGTPRRPLRGAGSRRGQTLRAQDRGSRVPTLSVRARVGRRRPQAADSTWETISILVEYASESSVARDYDAEVGRWTSRDPLRLSGSDTNLYRYANGDPINFRDPRGLDGDDSGGEGGTPGFDYPQPEPEPDGGGLTCEEPDDECGGGGAPGFFSDISLGCNPRNPPFCPNPECVDDDKDFCAICCSFYGDPTGDCVTNCCR